MDQVTEVAGSPVQPEMNAEQQAALADVERLRGEYIKAPSDQRDAIAAKISGRQRFAFGYGEKPADFMPMPDPKLNDTRPHDSERDFFEALAQPASAQQIKGAVDNAVGQGVNRQLAERAAAVCAELQLSEGHAKTLLDRVRAHHGAAADFGPDSEIRLLADSEVDEYSEEASRLLGSSLKLEELSLRARDFLAHRGVLEKFDSLGLTRSSLAFDPKLLHTLAMAADMAGIRRGKR